MKKIAPILLAVLLTLTLVAGAWAAPSFAPASDSAIVDSANGSSTVSAWEELFWDVTSSHWAYDDIYYLADYGILNGKTEYSFEPESRITRAEFAKVLTSCVDLDITEFEGYTYFYDVGDAWYTPFINFAYEYDVVTGYDDYFYPDNPITREEMAVMINRFAENVAGIQLPQLTAAVSFSDQGAISNWATWAVSVMQQATIINGYTDGTFRPANNATRAEAAKMVRVFFDLW